MGRRSRKRGLEPGAEPRHGSSRAERDAARRERAARARAGEGPASRRRPGRTSMHDRPPALWAPFPLTELLTLAGIALMVWGFLSGGGSEANSRIVAGLAIASLGGLELAVREHVTGFRSHSTLLAAAAGVVVVAALAFGAGVEVLGVLLVSGLAVATGAFWGLRELFRRRSGGLSFR